MKSPITSRMSLLFPALALLMLFFISCEDNPSSIATPEPEKIDCKGNYDHYKLQAEDAEQYMSLYKTYLNKIVIDNSVPGIPALDIPKFSGFRIPSCEIETMVRKFGPGLEAWAFIGIKEKLPTLIFKVKNPKDEDNNWTFFDFANPCPPACGLLPFDGVDCSGNFDHYMLPREKAASYIADYQNYLEKIQIDDSAPGTPTLNLPKVKGFQIPSCEFEAMVREMGEGMNVWANIGIKDGNASLIFKVSSSTGIIESRDSGDEFVYFDFTQPCPTFCPGGKDE